MTTGNGTPALHVVPTSDPMVMPTIEDLFKIASEKDSSLNMDDFQKIVEVYPDTKDALVEIFHHRAAEQAEKERKNREETERRAIEGKATELRKQINRELHDLKHPPKEPEEFLSESKIREMVGSREPTLAERLEELKQKYGNKFPSNIFNPETHEWVMGMRGFLIGVKLGFQREFEKVKDGDLKERLRNKCESVQRAINILTEIVKAGYQIDPNDKQKHCSPAIYKQILALAASDARLIEHTKMPETKEQAEQRLKDEAKQKEQAEAKQARQQAEREQMANAIIDRMVKVDHFAKMKRDNLMPIALRIARKFSGSTPESKLKMAAREKAGGSVKGQNRQLGAALARAAGCTEDEVKGMFPEAKQKKDKKNKQ
jgi:hypothetical protein